MESASFRLHECPELGERYYETRHPSGLRILVCPKDMSTAYAALGVPCGSFDRARGEPAGVAHFLEHKMFETARGGDAETAFAALGAEVNAYTTYDRTVYLFSCTEGRAGSFDRALGALLRMVSGLHITPDSVRRERRIIREEIRMGADDPWEVCANLLLRSLYRSHPIRGDICGTEASVGRITAEILHTAFSARYDRGGMTLAVCGHVTPEQVLAAVDASVGGKTAVDLDHGKNQVGCFYQPSLVLCDPSLLNTLPEREYRAGCAEIIKYAMLYSEDFLRELEETPVREQFERVISVCVGMKRDVVRGDEFDRGQRALLNLGHTVGHAVESCSGFTLLHGEGVAIGMAIITRAAVEKGLCTPETLPRLLAVLERYGLPTETDYPLTDILAAAEADKKRTDDVTKFIVPERVGHCRVEPVPADEVAGWLKVGGLR